MAKKKTRKTNAMRKLDQLKLDYSTSTYEAGGGIDTLHVAEALGVPAERIFKTIVLEADGPREGTATGAGHSSYAPAGTKAHFVAVIGADHELDLKKVAAHFGVKSVKLFDWKELKALTGYIRGGCSPIGMKRQFPTVVDSAAEELERIYVSAGEIGTQIILAPAVLAQAVSAEFAEIRH